MAKAVADGQGYRLSIVPGPTCRSPIRERGGATKGVEANVYAVTMSASKDEIGVQHLNDSGLTRLKRAPACYE